MGRIKAWFKSVGMTAEDLKALADAIRQEGVSKQLEAKAMIDANQGDAWIAKGLTRRAANLLAAAMIIDRLGNWRHRSRT